MDIDSRGIPPDIGPSGAISGLSRDKLPPAIISGNKAEGKNQKNNFLYIKNDLGPFHVYVESNSPNLKGKLSALKVNDIIYSELPQLDNKIKEIQSTGRNRVRVVFKDSQSANTLVSTKQLQNHNLEAYVPKYLVLRQGVISDIDLNITEESLKIKIRKFDFSCNFEVFSVKRIKKAVLDKATNEKKIVDTKSVIITFRCQTLPKYVAMGHVRIQVNPYIQRVILCYNCFRYGHSSKQCNSKTRCLNCKGDHKVQDCSLEKSIKCFHCNSDHATNELKKCVEFNRQKNIKVSMAQQNITYKEAEKLFPKNSYASTLSKNIIPADMNLSDLDFVLNSAQTERNNLSKNSNKTSYFTQYRTPQKRQRAPSPNPSLQEHNQILSQFKFSQNTGSILDDAGYQAGISREYSKSQTTINSNFDIMIELVTSVINILREKKSFDINKDELIHLINLKLKQVNL